MVADATVQRRLAAILAADVAGFSALMERDEEGTYSRIGNLRREVIEPRLSEHQGRLIKTTGDGFLAEFASPIAALRCALAIQRTQLDDPNALRLRIGLNLGDVIIEHDGDVYGEGVNVAARLEGLADPGGILISGKIHSEVEGKVKAFFEDRGEQQVKNISRPVHIYAVHSAAVPTSSARAAVESLRPLALPDKPSIAVLPFQNMSGDPEQEYFADGMVEDIITELSRFKGLFVIARNSSFTYKGKPADIKQVGRELGVRYVLEGSVRKSGQRVRITGQLIEAATSAHLWADKFEGQLQDTFDLQDKVAVSVVGAIAPRLIDAEVDRVKRTPLIEWNAYDHYLKGLALYGQRNAEANSSALILFRKAIELKPDFGLAYTRAAACIALKPTFQGSALTDEERSEAIRLNDRALTLEPTDSFVLAWASLIFAFTADDLIRGFDYVNQALAINPNLSNAWNARGWIDLCRNDSELEHSLEAFDRAIRLNPFDDWTVFIAMRGKCFTFWALGRYPEAIEQAQKLIARAPDDLYAWFTHWLINADPNIRLKFPQLRSSVLRRLFVEPVRSSGRRAMLDDAVDRLSLPD